MPQNSFVLLFWLGLNNGISLDAELCGFHEIRVCWLMYWEPVFTAFLWGVTSQDNWVLSSNLITFALNWYVCSKDKPCFAELALEFQKFTLDFFSLWTCLCAFREWKKLPLKLARVTVWLQQSLFVFGGLKTKTFLCISDFTTQKNY